MKNLIRLLFAIALAFSFSSCEKETFDIVQKEELSETKLRKYYPFLDDFSLMKIDKTISYSDIAKNSISESVDLRSTNCSGNYGFSYIAPHPNGGNSIIVQDAYYTSENNERQSINALFPLPSPNGIGNGKVVVIVHGGAWNWGGRKCLEDSFIEKVPQALYNSGYAVVVMNYRYADNNPEEQFEDIKTVLEDLIEPINYENILLGESAGGHLASLYTLLGGDNIVDGLATIASPTDINHLKNWSNLKIFKRQPYNTCTQQLGGGQTCTLTNECTKFLNVTLGGSSLKQWRNKYCDFQPGAFCVNPLQVAQHYANNINNNNNYNYITTPCFGGTTAYLNNLANLKFYLQMPTNDKLIYTSDVNAYETALESFSPNSDNVEFTEYSSNNHGFEGFNSNTQDLVITDLINWLDTNF